MRASKNTAKAAEPNSGKDMVTVAYNAARGIIFSLNGKSIHINGSNIQLMGKEKGVIPVGQYGYTRIPAGDWEAIRKTYGSMEIFKNGLIFAEKSQDKAQGRAEEQAETRHGLEPVDPETTHTEEAKGEA
jgi:hypothetical protein